MFKKLIIIILSSILVLFQSLPVNASDSIRYKSSENQVINSGRWTTLNFNGKKSIKGNGNRSLFCYQVAIDMRGKKKPKYIKIRFVREKSNGLDTTATNIYPVPDKPSNTWVGSGCWAIKTNSPVVLQVRVTGGSKTYVSDMRQFKMWTPGANYPQDFSDFIPQGSL